MNIWLRRFLLLFGSALAAIAFFVGRYAAAAGPVGTGYKAKIGCSAIFVSERDPAVVQAEDLVLGFPLEDRVTITVDRQAESVTASFFGMASQTAIHREGLGCTLLAGHSAADLRAQQSRSTDLPTVQPTPGAPWPLGDAGVEGTPPEILQEVDQAALQAAFDDAFSEPDPQRLRRTRAVAVAYRGHLVGERYAPGYGPETALMGWSMTKSLTNTLAGLAAAAGHLDVQAPADAPEWQEDGDERAAITLDQLLRMSSGLEFDETYAPGTNATIMLFDAPNAAAFAADQPAIAPPEEVWYYSSGTSNLVSRIVRHRLEAAGEDYLSYPRRALFNPLGMTSAVIEPDASGTFVGSSFSYATARDWARLGQLYLQDGVWNGERLLPEGWVTYTRAPTPKAPKGRYGAHFWLNAGTSEDPSTRPWPELPADLFWMSGFEGQSVVIIPSRDVVIVRLGLSQRDSSWRLSSFLAAVLESLPEAP